MALRTGKQALIEQLVADGTRYIFGNPGTTEQGFMDALQDYPQLEFILALHEGVAVGAADAYARATRRPGFVELHIAPGLGNGLGMIYNAARGHTPLVVYAGQSDSRALVQEPVLSGDLVRMAQSVCKWSAEALYATDVPRLLRRAMKVAAEPPQGPVFLSLPLDVLDQEAEITVTPTTFTRWRSRPELDAVREAAALLAGAQRPLLVIGDGVALSGAQAEVAAAAELLGAPILGTFTSEVNVSFDHPLWSGSINVLNGDMARAQLEGADVLLMVGTPVVPSVFPALAGPLPDKARVIQVDIDTWELAKNTPVDIAIAADPKATLAELVDLMRGLMTSEQLKSARKRGADHAERRRNDDERLRRQDQQHRDQKPIAATRLMEELAAAIPAEAAIFDESNTSGAAMPRYLRPAPGRYFRGRGGGIGTGMPGAVGLQLAFPDRPVIGIVADGSAMYTNTALWTAAHHQLPVTWVICNNRSYRILKLNLLAYLGEAAVGRRLMATDLVDPPIAFDRLAESMGVRGRRVEHPDELGDALREAITYPGPSLVEVLLDPSVP